MTPSRQRVERSTKLEAYGIIRFLEFGWTLKMIGETFGMTAETVRAIERRHFYLDPVEEKELRQAVADLGIE